MLMRSPSVRGEPIGKGIVEFNLVDERWLPCAEMDGKPVELSITEALVRSHELRELRDSSPLTTAALHRLLLAVIHSAYRGPQSVAAWRALWSAGRADQKMLGDYLVKWHDRFNLFDASHPFYQVAGFSIDATRPACQLEQEIARGNNATLFDHTTEASSPALTSARAARALVTNQAYAVGGGNGSTSALFGKHPNLKHAPLVAGITVLLKGETLFETLMLNLLLLTAEAPIPCEKDDAPAWERSQGIQHPGERPVRGWLDLLTWQSRCISLIEKDDRVSEMYYAQGNSLSKTSAREPMWFYRESKKPGEYLPVRLCSERAVWRDVDSLLTIRPDRAGETRPRAFRQINHIIAEDDTGIRPGNSWRCSLMGLENDKALVLRWTQEDLPLHPQLLEDSSILEHLRVGMEKCESAASALRTAEWVSCSKFLVPEDVGRTVDRDTVRSLTERVRAQELFWSDMSGPFRHFMEDVAVNPGLALTRWLETVKRTAYVSFAQSADTRFGRSARGLRARVEGDRVLAGELTKAGLGSAANGGEV